MPKKRRCEHGKRTKGIQSQKKGKITPKTLIEGLLEAIENDEIESVVYVAHYKDQAIRLGRSDCDSTEALGLLTCGQHEIINDMYE